MTEQFKSLLEYLLTNKRIHFDPPIQIHARAHNLRPISIINIGATNCHVNYREVRLVLGKPTKNFIKLDRNPKLKIDMSAFSYSNKNQLQLFTIW